MPLRFRPLPALSSLVVLLAGLALFKWGTGHLRGFGGDVLIVILLVGCLASIDLGRPRLRLVAVGLFAFGTECFQGLGLVAPDAHWLLHLTVGSTFDPLDLLAYVLGLGLAAGLERLWVVRERGSAG